MTVRCSFQYWNLLPFHLEVVFPIFLQYPIAANCPWIDVLVIFIDNYPPFDQGPSGTKKVAVPSKGWGEHKGTPANKQTVRTFRHFWSSLWDVKNSRVRVCREYTALNALHCSDIASNHWVPIRVASATSLWPHLSGLKTLWTFVMLMDKATRMALDFTSVNCRACRYCRHSLFLWAHFLFAHSAWSSQKSTS